MSLSKRKTVKAASEQQNTAGGEVQVPWVVLRSGGRQSEKIDSRIGKANAVLR